MKASTNDPSRHRTVALGVLALAALLRGCQAWLRWDEVTWLYSAYPGATTDALARGDIGTALTTFTGLHPPLWSILHAASELVLPIPFLWLLASALASWGAVYLVLRQSIWAGALLATAPLQLHYAAEVNDYPLATLWVALAWTGHARAKSSGRWGLLATAGILAAWTHLLAGAAAAAAALTLPRSLSVRIVGLMALSWIVLVPEALSLLSEGGSTLQPEFKATLVIEDYLRRFGPWALLALPPLVVGARKRPDIASAWLGTTALIGLLVWAGFAAPHQFPYPLFIGIPAVLLLAHALEPTWSRRWIIGLIAGQLIWGLVSTGSRLVELNQDEVHAIDTALAELETPWTCDEETVPTPDCTGDALVLLAPAGLNDDDKNRISPVLWRLPPWQRMPRVTPYAFEHADHRHGQPRLVNGHAIYVHDHPRETLETLLAAHKRVFLVVYEQGQRTAYHSELSSRLGQKPSLIGKDLLFRLP